MSAEDVQQYRKYQETYGPLGTSGKVREVEEGTEEDVKKYESLGKRLEGVFYRVRGVLEDIRECSVSGCDYGRKLRPRRRSNPRSCRRR